MIEVPDAVDVVGVYGDAFRQYFESTHIMRAVVNESSQLMKQPREDGTTTVDHRVILPVEMQLSVLLPPGDFQNAYYEIKSAYERGESFSVKTRTSIHQNMVLSAMPREETAAEPDLVKIVLVFEEVKYMTAQFQALPPRAVANKSDSSTAKRGQQSNTSKRRSGSTLHRTIYGG